MDIIEIARGCGLAVATIEDGKLDIITMSANRYRFKQFAQRIEQPHLQRIAELEFALQKQAKAALMGMDAAKASGAAMLKAATEIQSKLKPELLDSERQANSVLTEENEKLNRQIEQLREALHGMMAIIADSRGVAGYHLNGAIAEWDEFDEITQAEKALEETSNG